MVRFFRRRPEAPAEAPDTLAAPAPDQTAVAEAPSDQAQDGPRSVDQAVERTKRTWFGRIGGMFRRGLDDALWEELEETLIAADTGVETATKLLNRLRERVRSEGIRDPEEALGALRDELTAILQSDSRAPQGRLWASPDGSPFDKLRTSGGGDAGPEAALRQAQGEREGPAVILVVGVNGTGKTTSIGKLAHAYRGQGLKVLLAAGDTFRAAAIDQLKQWGELAGVDVVAHQQGADPGAVVFDAMAAAEKRSVDVVIIDTAGRLHTKANLMEELRKVNRVIQRKFPDAPHEVLLVLDATTGQNALTQAKYFTEAVGVTGILLAKLDGTAKGGVIFAVCDQLGVPVRFVGTGERLEDLAPFRPREFVEALFD